MRREGVKKVQLRRDDGKTHLTLWYVKGREMTYTFRKQGNFTRAADMAASICAENGLTVPVDMIDQRRSALKKKQEVLFERI